MELQELISRARLLFSSAPKRHAVFNLINGKKSAKEIAIKTGKSLSATLQDLQKMKDLELVNPKENEEGDIVKKDNSIVYEKNPILKHLSTTYFEDPTRLPITQRRNKELKNSTSERVPAGIVIPNESGILDICKDGEDQLYEFKRAGTEMRVLSKEICGFANTRMGGLIFYGVDDDGAIGNSDKRRQEFDQSLQNSIRSNISPALSIKIIEKDVLGHKILLIYIPPWNRTNVYQFDGRVYIRQGTNVFVAKPEELKKLHNEEYII